MKALLDRLEKPIQQAFAIAVSNARTSAQISALTKALIAGDEAAILLGAGIREGMWSPLTESVRSAYFEGGATTLATTVPKRFGMQFDINNPRAEDWLRSFSATKVKGQLQPEQIKAIQSMMSDGMRKGKNPRTIALDIVGRIAPNGRRSGGVIGLTGQQAKFVDNMADDLEELNWDRYSKRKLRDRRFDKAVKRSIDEGKPLPKKQRQRIVDRYSDRMVKHRGDTIGRTEALHALNEASDEAMRQVVDEGLAPKNAIVKIWRHSFGKDEREGHRALNGVAKSLDESFTNPVTFRVMKYPGDPAGGPGEVINCRCYIEHQVDFFSVEQVA